MIISELIHTKKGKIITTQRVFVTCDQCNKNFDLRYRSVIENRNNYGTDLCQSCRLKLQYKNGSRSSYFKIYNQSDSNKGTFVEKYGEEKANSIKKVLSDKRKGENNPNYGGKYSKGKEMVAYTKLYEGKTYEERYGKEKAAEMKKNLSEKSSGSNNPMYGKPSPVGSGNGWAGWYNGVYFRSLLELSYMKYLHDNNISYINGEILSIPYVINNKVRNYYPDFIIDNKIIEIKPYKLINSELNKCKFEAAKKLYKDNFIVLTDRDIILLKFEDINTMVNEGSVVFIERYKVKFENWRKKYE